MCFNFNKKQVKNAILYKSFLVNKKKQEDPMLENKQEDPMIKLVIRSDGQENRGRSSGKGKKK